MLPANAGRAAQQQPYSLSVNVDLVVLNVRVLDKNGLAVTGLSKEAFHIEEDGKPQTISLFAGEEGPATIGLVLDSSASINSKQSQIREAALRFVQSSHPRDELFVLQFNERLYWMLPDELPFTNNIDLLDQALAWTPAAGKTALYDAIGASLAQAGRGEWEKRALIVLTDGGDNASRRTLSDVLRLAQESNVTIYTIGLFDPLSVGNSPSVLKKLANLTGGDMYLPQSAEQLVPAWEKISQGIRTQYTVGYRPGTASFDGRFHKVRVRVDAPGHPNLSVHTRPGYRARKSATEP
jgi:VWFA-related protein